MPQGVQLFRGTTTVTSNGSTPVTLFTLGNGVTAARVILNQLIYYKSNSWGSTTPYASLTLSSANGYSSPLYQSTGQQNNYAIAAVIADHPVAVNPSNNGYNPVNTANGSYMGTSSAYPYFTGTGAVNSWTTFGVGLPLRNFYMGPSDSVVARFFGGTGSANIGYSFTVITEF